MKLSRQAWVSIRAMLVITVVCGILYPLAVWGLGSAMPSQADGSLVTRNGTVVGSSLIGQSFTDKKGNALPQWFQSRPSAAGNGYDGGASSGSNYGPENKDLISAIKSRQAAIEKLDGVSAEQIPADALTASASGLDPHISEAYALLQVPRIAHARGLAEADVRSLVEKHVQGRDLGYLGEPTVNVLELNLALTALK
ncbi:potassium-transporting ATPase subunit KdpC [Lysinimonas soli]|uniref:Potassium-transporting ATPase KdpC subunit n=1 Tax=Lysinimonas soli TaxID=1074233 RepID=A0ABW0NNC6_9MICO